jgi:hypothetical protein
MTQRDTESPDGSSTDNAISRKVKISKLLPTSCKPNSEKTSKDCSRSDQTEVSDTNGDSRLEDSTPKPPEEEEKLSVSRERKNDRCYLDYQQISPISFIIH